jgi:hypothetical protein
VRFRASSELVWYQGVGADHLDRGNVIVPMRRESQPQLRISKKPKSTSQRHNGILHWMNIPKKTSGIMSTIGGIRRFLLYG